MVKQHLFIVDPIENILPKIHNDSSSLLIQTGLKRGHEMYMCYIEDLIMKTEGLMAFCQKVNSVSVENGYSIEVKEMLLAKNFDTIWLRKNPPFDETYLMHLALLDQISHHKVFFINNPTTVRELNEKLTIFYFPQYIAPTLVTMKLEELKNFWNIHKKIVMKGLTGFGGDSVIAVENWQKDEEKILKLSQNGTRFLMAQKFLDEVYVGDKRVTILDGEVVGALLRVPPQHSFIAYTGGGATVEQTELTDREMEISKNVGKFLKEKGIFWAGLDIIGGYLSEINITSPSLLAAANRQFKLNLEEKIWIKVEEYI